MYEHLKNVYKCGFLVGDLRKKGGKAPENRGIYTGKGGFGGVWSKIGG